MNLRELDADQDRRASFKTESLILGENDTWHSLETCLWNAPFPLIGYQDLATIYPTLENFFVKCLKLKKPDPSILINEVRRIASGDEPNVPEIKERLVGIGMLLTRGAIDDRIAHALDALRDVNFLPMLADDGMPLLLGVKDNFAITDHQRYAEAFGESRVLLDFAKEEVAIMHVMFRHLGLEHRYLSATVREVSMVGEESIADEGLSQQMQAKAYALYW